MKLIQLLTLSLLASLLFLGVRADDEDDDDEDLSVGSDSETVFADTHALTELWGMVSRADNDALVNFVIDHGHQHLHSRASDRRGPAWWAFEFKNAFALAVLKSQGVNIESKDEDTKGLTAQDMCNDAGCDPATLVSDAMAMVEKVKERIQTEKTVRADQRAAAEAAADASAAHLDDVPDEDEDF